MGKEIGTNDRTIINLVVFATVSLSNWKEREREKTGRSVQKQLQTCASALLFCVSSALVGLKRKKKIFKKPVIKCTMMKGKAAR